MGGLSAPRSGAARSVLAEALGLPDLRDGLMGSSFFYSRALEDGDGSPDRAGWLGDWSAWGETAATRFGGADGPLSLDGEVATATLGVDSRWARWFGGLALSYSEGEGAYTHREASGAAVSSTLTSLHPFARYEVNERTSVWGVLGYGVGALTLTPQRGPVPEPDVAGIETDLASATEAFGGRTVLSVRAGAAGAFELALASDVRLTNTVSESVESLVGAAGVTSRVRLMLEGSGSIRFATGAVLTPTLEAVRREARRYEPPAPPAAVRRRQAAHHARPRRRCVRAPAQEKARELASMANGLKRPDLIAVPLRAANNEPPVAPVSTDRRAASGVYPLPRERYKRPFEFVSVAPAAVVHDAQVAHHGRGRVAPAARTRGDKPRAAITGGVSGEGGDRDDGVGRGRIGGDDDEVMAAALIDRLLHHCHIVNIRGNSYRMRHQQDLLRPTTEDRRDGLGR